MSPFKRTLLEHADEDKRVNAIAQVESGLRFAAM
jgi:hypothetical protein